jgi:hypothetical protein
MVKTKVELPDWVKENRDAPAGKWMRSGSLLYTLAERTDDRRFYKGILLKENSVAIRVDSRDGEDEAKRIAEHIKSLIEKDCGG